MKKTAYYDSPWGTGAVAESEEGVVKVILPKKTKQEAKAAILTDVPDAVFVKSLPAAKLLSLYFNGKKTDFSSFHLDPSAATPKQKKVWAETRKIPSGETRTYGHIAEKTGLRPRAVGQALKANHTPIIVPCHRVVAAKGLGGYNLGMMWKKRLLRLEH
ncbi:Methylated-DNA--protein-cysteine methyltransferase [uncultured archaeon]|nr:Methylated-DNA--protein-cysteine methyltransferase [uncultured archaeon]